MTDGAESPAGRVDPLDGADGAAQRGRRALNPLSVAGHLEYDRVLFFSDAVFAIAITLLVVDIRVPDIAGVVNAYQALHDARYKILGFAISFLVIGLFWMGHHRLYRYITALDRSLIFLNLLFLIAFLPYRPLCCSQLISQVAPRSLRHAAWLKPRRSSCLALRHPG
jgi:hypothetical protein